MRKKEIHRQIRKLIKMHSEKKKIKVHKRDRSTGDKRKTPVLSLVMYIFSAVLIVSMLCLLIVILTEREDDKIHQAETDALREIQASEVADQMNELAEVAFSSDFIKIIELKDVAVGHSMLPSMKVLYEQNPHIIGWITIEDTKIDYPVMQTPEDENFYLKRSFYGEENDNGCLIMDTDSVVGVGIANPGYDSGAEPSANLIIHGHNMRSGEMFGDLELYQKETYAKEHSVISFNSLYEHREYEVIAVFYSQVYYASEDVFKYYKFFEADSQAEFDEWYENIKELSIYDTDVTAEYGDEFITLSTCAYHVEDGRFVVVGRRIW